MSESSGVKAPLLAFPNSVTRLNASLLTLLSNLIKKPPLWDLAKDQVATMIEGFHFDGSKAEQELGIKYTPIHNAIEETVQSYL